MQRYRHCKRTRRAIKHGFDSLYVKRHRWVDAILSAEGPDLLLRVSRGRNQEPEDADDQAARAAQSLSGRREHGGDSTSLAHRLAMTVRAAPLCDTRSLPECALDGRAEEEEGARTGRLGVREGQR